MEKALPHGPEKKWWEFAKDVAAMANTGGGLIVFGVSEDTNERADELIGVANGKSERQTLHSYAARWVRPLIGDLAIEPLDDEQDGRGLIAVFVPASPDAPHVIGEKSEMGVPYRYGPHTNWMSEGELEHWAAAMAVPLLPFRRQSPRLGRVALGGVAPQRRDRSCGRTDKHHSQVEPLQRRREH